MNKKRRERRKALKDFTKHYGKDFKLEMQTMISRWSSTQIQQQVYPRITRTIPSWMLFNYGEIEIKVLSTIEMEGLK